MAPSSSKKGETNRAKNSCTYSAYQFLLLGTVVTVGLLFEGCAGVTVTALDPATGKAKDGAEEGLRYYLPAPYLLVAELPPTPMAPKGDASNNPPTQVNPFTNSADVNAPTNHAPDQPDSPGAAAPTNTTANPSAPTQGGSPQVSATDTSFGGSTPQYIIKLVYLPDMSKPMAMSEHTGLFGTAEMKPSLQDGWMLTSLDATADSKTAETLTAIASLVSAAAGPLTGGATQAATTAAKGVSKPGGNPTGQGKNQPQDLRNFFDAGGSILRPGLYKFIYDAGGNLTGLKPVVFFSGYGTTTQIPANSP